MAEPSRAGWHNLPRDKRVCARCGAKLTLRTPGGFLWRNGPDGGLESVRVFHGDRRLCGKENV